MIILMRIGILLLCMAISGCGWWNTVFRDFKVDDGTGAMIDIKQRAVMASRQPSPDGQNGAMQTIVCAEPSPDALAAYAAELAGKVDVLGKVNAGVTGASQESAAFVGLRTQSIQLLRDSLYRLCEGYLSGALNKDEYSLLTRRYQRYMIALLGIEQLTGALRSPTVTISTEGKAKVAASLTEMRKQLEIIDQEILQKKAVQIALEGEKANSGTTEGRKKQIEAEIKGIKTAILEQQADKDAINAGIADARGKIAEGFGTATVNPISIPLQRSDLHIQTVSGVVEKIVMEAMSVDDLGHFCWRYLTDTKNTDEALKNTCKNRLTQNDQDREYARTTHRKWFDLVTSNNDLTPQQKFDLLGPTFSAIFARPPNTGAPTVLVEHLPGSTLRPQAPPSLTSSPNPSDSTGKNFRYGAIELNHPFPKPDEPVQIHLQQTSNISLNNVTSLEGLKQQLRAKNVKGVRGCIWFKDGSIYCYATWDIDELNETAIQWLGTKSSPDEYLRFLQESDPEGFSNAK